MGTNGEFADHIFLQLTANVLDRDIVITRVISNQVTTISPVNGVGGNLIYPALNGLFYEENYFIHGHYQSIRPAIVQPQPQQVPITRPQAPLTNSTIEQVPATRSQLPSVNSTIGHPILHSTNINQTTNVNCDATCDTSNQNSTRTRISRESSYLSTSNIIQKRTRNAKK